MLLIRKSIISKSLGHTIQNLQTYVLKNLPFMLSFTFDWLLYIVHSFTNIYVDLYILWRYARQPD